MSPTRDGVRATERTLTWLTIASVAMGLCSPVVAVGVSLYVAGEVSDQRITRLERDVAGHDAKIAAIQETLSDIKQGIARIEVRLRNQP